MDRILDSGSNDWGSTPHGRTYKGIKESVSGLFRHALFLLSTETIAYKSCYLWKLFLSLQR